MHTDSPLLQVDSVSVHYGLLEACADIDLTLWPGEVLGIVGESGSGKTTLLKALSAQLEPSSGTVNYRTQQSGMQEIYTMRETDRRKLKKSEWGFIHQSPKDGLRMNVSAGGNIVESLVQNGVRHYGDMRSSAESWLEKVQVDVSRINERPDAYSGGMQQRLQIARNLVVEPRLVFMDEPTGGLDVSVQAKLLDLLRELVIKLDLSVIMVTHDLGVARHISHRLLVMKDGKIVESGLTDQVLDDPQHPYTQLLVSSILIH